MVVLYILYFGVASEPEETIEKEEVHLSCCISSKVTILLQVGVIITARYIPSQSIIRMQNGTFHSYILIS
jgi:hypothetical protein